MKTGKPSHTIHTVFTLALLGAFSACVLLVLMTGARVYKDSVSQAEFMFEKRTCIAYITEKIRHLNSKDAVLIYAFGDGAALSLTESVGQTRYETLIYTYNGKLMELYRESGLSLRPDDGTEIAASGEISFSWIGPNILSVRAGGDEAYVCVLGGGEGA